MSYNNENAFSKAGKKINISTSEQNQPQPDQENNKNNEGCLTKIFKFIGCAVVCIIGLIILLALLFS